MSEMSERNDERRHRDEYFLVPTDCRRSPPLRTILTTTRTEPSEVEP
jgi:hypothetical protein